MLSGRVQYQGKAGFLKLNFQFSNSQNTGKCKLGRFCSNSHIWIGNFSISFIHKFNHIAICSNYQRSYISQMATWKGFILLLRFTSKGVHFDKGKIEDENFTNSKVQFVVLCDVVSLQML